MRQVIMTEPGKVDHRDVEAPSAGKGEVLLRIQRIGVCGSDVHVYHGTHPFTGYPVVQGHEFSATVEAVGEGVEGIEVGAKATATPQLTCGACPACRRGDYHICRELKVMGFQAPGVAQELFAMPAWNVLTLPEEFTFEQGALVEPVAVAAHAVCRAGDVSGRRAVVFGAGPIGNLVAQVARARGAEVLISEVSDRRLTVARECGLERVHDARTGPLGDAVETAFGGEGFSLAFECAGVEATINSALESIEKGGTIVQVALFGQRPTAHLALLAEHEKSLIGSMMYKKDDYRDAIDLIASGEIATEPLISRHVAMGEYLNAYEIIEREGDEVMKVMWDVE
jgi:2-desacetyl-2-hydroxyethyl bacteriochlorophyllide A dehydrogenase